MSERTPVRHLCLTASFALLASMLAPMANAAITPDHQRARDALLNAVRTYLPGITETQLPEDTAFCRVISKPVEGWQVNFTANLSLAFRMDPVRNDVDHPKAERVIQRVSVNGAEGSMDSEGQGAVFGQAGWYSIKLKWSRGEWEFELFAINSDTRLPLPLPQAGVMRANVLGWAQAIDRVFTDAVDTDELAIGRSMVLAVDRTSSSPATWKRVTTATSRLVLLMDKANTKAREDRVTWWQLFAEWALMTFTPDEVELVSDFTQDPWKTWSEAKVPLSYGLPQTDSSGDPMRPIVWAVTQALIHANTFGKGRFSQVILVTDAGTDASNASFRGQSPQLRRLNWILGTILVPRTQRQARAFPSFGLGPALSLPFAAMGRTLGAGDSIDQALDRLERMANAGEAGAALNILAIDVPPGSAADAAFRSLAEAGGGQYVPMQASDDPEKVAGVLIDRTGKVVAGVQPEANRPRPTQPTQPEQPTQPTQPPPPPEDKPEEDQPKGEQDGQEYFLIVTDSMEDGMELTPRSSFKGAKELWAFFVYEDEKPPEELRGIWYRDGEDVQTEVSAFIEGGAAMYYLSGDGAALQPGQYRIEVKSGDRVLISKAFTVR